MYDNIILTDCDGVLLNWQKGFANWMIKHGFEPVVDNPAEIYHANEIFGISREESKLYVKMFNESAHIAYLNPLRDAMYYIDMLHRRHGYVFHVISSVTDDEIAGRLRIQNLENIFGTSVFERYTFLACGADKDEALEEYAKSGYYFIEDKLENAMLPQKHNYNIKPILMAHNYNKDSDGSIPRFQNWEGVYNHITGSGQFTNLTGVGLPGAPYV